MGIPWFRVSYPGSVLMHFQIGETVGDYEIIGVLGRGGMGKVFRVRNLLSQRVEAMKIVLPDIAGNADVADRFLREIRVHASLEHPHIAHLRTALRVDNQVVMIMELVEGTSLDECLASGSVSLRDGIRYVEQVLSALDYAHALGVVHRDIKPANIIVGPDGLVKLTDFGIARSPGDCNLTHGGVALGSVYYMSPEQVRAEPLDGRSDLYSLGVTLYEIATGRRPIQGDSEYDILNGHLSQTPAPPMELQAEISASLNAVILRALAKKPADRFSSANEFRDALTAATGPHASITSTHLDRVRLGEVEAALMTALGPIARHLVTRAARQASSIEELCRTLAEQIGDGRDRKTFLRAVGAPGVSGTTTTAAIALPVWEASFLSAVKQALAMYAGPIAGVMVDRASRKARSKAELYEALAGEIGSAEDRKAFLARLPG
jgi:serine/threonine protein kinase